MKQYIINYKKIVCLFAVAFMAFPMLLKAQAFPDAVVDSVGPVPVTLISFTATKVEKNVQLNWATANEKNLSHFNLQRSTDGVNFETIGSVKSMASYNYSYTDVNVQQRNLYYRLASVDADGKTSLSNIVMVKYATAKAEDWSIYPNPTIGKNITIDTKNLSAGQYNISLKNMKGEVLFSKPISITGTNNAITLQLPATVAKGLYVLSLTSADGSMSSSKKIIVE